MKKPTLLILFFFCFKIIFGQVVITDQMFPMIGDSILLLNDELPNGIDLGNSGPNQYWDFSNLLSPVKEVISVEDPDKGFTKNNFPTSDLIFNIDNEIQRYFKKTPRALQEIGVWGPDPMMDNQPINARYSPPLPLFRAPMKYGDEHDVHSSLLIALDPDKLPDTLLSLLPSSIDSARIRIEVNRLDEVDAWGKLRLSHRSYDVLRERRMEIVERRLDVKKGSDFWVDITDELPPNKAFLPSRSVSYYYFTNELREPVAIVNLDGAGNINSVQYHPDPFKKDFLKNKNGTPDIIAYPNPTFGELRFYFSNLKPGYYQLKIITIIGKEILSQTHFVNGEKTIKIEDLGLGKGSYFYSLIDDRRKTIKTKRFLVVTP
jgi:hypothetical protein